jgi:hypothetical protein
VVREAGIMRRAVTRRTNINESVDTALAELCRAANHGESEALKAYLRAMSHFHNYSVGNLLLVWSQRPDATRIASFHAWKKLRRFVRQGEKGIVIMARGMRSNRRSKEKIDSSTTAGVKTISVFDVSQTDGEPLPTPEVSSKDPADCLNRLLVFVAELGIELRCETLPPAVCGVSLGGVITIDGTLTPAEMFTTLTHELARGMIHRNGRRVGETTESIDEEARAVTFVVEEAMGLTLGRAPDRIWFHRGTKVTLADSLELIQQSARSIIKGIMPDPLAA